MKRAVFVFIAPLLVFFTTGCASSGKATLLANKDPIALVSVVSNEDVNWKDEEIKNPATIGPLIRRKLNSDPDLAVITKADEIIVMAENIIRDSIAASPKINLAVKEIALNSRAYQDAKIKKYPNRDVIKPEEYRFPDYRDKIFASALAAETGIQRSMHVEFNFTKSVYSGLFLYGTCRANVEMTVIIVDEKGKVLYRRTNTVPGGSSTRITNGIYSQSELKELFRESLSDVCYLFLEQL